MNEFFKPELDVEKEVLTNEEVIKKYTKMGLLKKVDLLGLSTRVNNHMYNQNIIYIGDLVLKTEIHFLETPKFGRRGLNQLNAALDKMGLHLGMKLRYWPLKDMEAISSHYNERLAYQNNETLKEAFSHTIEKITDSKNRIVMEMRFGLHGKPLILGDIAQELGVSRQRVSQIEQTITQKILKQEFWCEILRIRLQNLLEDRTTPLFLDAIEHEDTWFAGFSDNITLLENLLAEFSHIKNIHFLLHEQRKIVTRLSYQQWQDIKDILLNTLKNSLEQNYTMEDIRKLVYSELLKANVAELSSLFFDSLSKELKFSTINGKITLISVGNAVLDHLRVLLETLEKPTHFREISELYQQKYGVKVSINYIHSCLIEGDFLLFDRGTYGLAKHLKIPKPVQDSIRCKIEDTILASSSEREWDTRDLIAQFSGEPYAEALNRYTINIIMKSTKDLRCLGKFSWKDLC